MNEIEILLIFLSSLAIIGVPILWVRSRKEFKATLENLDKIKEKERNRDRFAEEFSKDL